MTNYDMANERINEDIANNKVDETNDNTNANNYAKNIMNTYEQDAMSASSASSAPQSPMSAPLSQQYQPPVPPKQQSPVPQQSQHMMVSPQQVPANAVASSGASAYTGFDASDNLAPLDASFVPVKQPMRQSQRANPNSDPRTNDTVEPYSNEENELFSPF